MSTNPPKNMKPNEIPQLVFLTFDDAITVSNYDYYVSILKNRVNPNGQPISMTFYVTHEYNDYVKTHDLFYMGNEIACHSVTHKNNQTYWSSAPSDVWMHEVEDMRKIIAKFANINETNIKGHRAPFLQTSGKATFDVLNNLGMYDNSLPTQSYIDPPIFPYTLDNGFHQDCAIPPCPSEDEKFNGSWVVPMVDLVDRNNTVCNMADMCARPRNASETLSLLKDNFLKHYKINKAPYGIYLHSSWFEGFPYTLTGYTQFLDYLANFDDVYVVSVGQGVEWMKNPKNVTESAKMFVTPKLTPSKCLKRNCYYDATDDFDEHVMASCVQCPDQYPWYGNPYGEANL